MSLVPSTFLLIMAMSSAIIVWLVAREVAKRMGYPTIAGGVKCPPLEAN